MSALKIGPKTFEWGARTIVMGILNITPDSFSGDGLLLPSLPSPLSAGEEHKGEGGMGGALDQARRFLSAGADILDVGGESTRPGSQTVTATEEMERVLPVIRALSKPEPNSMPFTAPIERIA